VSPSPNSSVEPARRGDFACAARGFRLRGGRFIRRVTAALPLAVSRLCAAARVGSSRANGNGGGAAREAEPPRSPPRHSPASPLTARVLVRSRRCDGRSTPPVAASFRALGCDVSPVNGESSPLTGVGLRSADAGRLSERPDEGAARLLLQQPYNYIDA